MVRIMSKLVLCMILCCVPLLSCGRMDKKDDGNISEVPTQDNNGKKPDDKTLHHTTDMLSYGHRISENVGTVKKDSDLYFKLSLEEFIDCYNANYYKDKGTDYIESYSKWYSYIQDFGRYQGDTHYEFAADKKRWTLPTITVYTPQNEMLIKELTVNFDDHSYTDKMYQQYEEMCFYTLKVFFPDMDERELTRLYKKLNENAYANIFQNEQGFHSGHPPSDLYYKNGVGVYPYFAYGESVRMCIIPVTKKGVISYQKKGVKIHKL